MKSRRRADAVAPPRPLAGWRAAGAL